MDPNPTVTPPPLPNEPQPKPTAGPDAPGGGTPAPDSPPVPGASSAVEELQKRLDETTVAKDKEINDLKGKLAETERRYNIAVKTGSKTDVQAQPVSNDPVGAWINQQYANK